jgi:hypothetical protein
MSLTPEQRSELRRLHEEATPGPWFANVDSDGPLCESAVYVGTDNLGSDLEEYPSKNEGVVAVLLLQSGGVMIGQGGDRYDEDAKLIAAIRSALPALLDAADALDDACAERDEANRLLIEAETRLDPMTVAEEGDFERLRELARLPGLSSAGATAEELIGLLRTLDTERHARKVAEAHLERAEALEDCRVVSHGPIASAAAMRLAAADVALRALGVEP